MKTIDAIAFWLVILGGLTWGVWGALQWNIIDYFFDQTRVDFILYVLIGVSSIYLVVRKCKNCCFCNKG
jgi:hypothetical protein